MTPKEWLSQATRDKDVLTEFVRSWHPARMARDPFDDPALIHLPITAPRAEQVCSAVRKHIRDQERGTDPACRFELALATGAAHDAYSLLSSSWIGVPESTSCWGIEGFKEAVDLLEDPPDEEEQPETVNVIANKVS